MTIPAYPLQWPTGWKRCDAALRTRARFAKKREQINRWCDATGQERTSRYMRNGEVTIAEGVERVRTELERMGVRDDDVVISSNLTLRLDGLPRSGQAEPRDPGVAVYWRDNSKEGWPLRCMAIDRYDRVADNLAAVAATLDAMRAIERHGGAEILDRAFTGFTALPPPEQAKPWHTVFGVAAHESTDAVRAAYRRLRSETHPDRQGGDADAFNVVRLAWTQFCTERGITE